MLNNCAQCGTETKNPKFCSRSCTAVYNNKIFPKRKLNKLCNKESCNNVVKSYRHVLCELHFNEQKNNKFEHKTIAQCRDFYSLKGKHKSWLNVRIRQYARLWHKDLTKLPCFKCGYNKHVELAHIKPVSSFPDDTLIKVVNSKENVIQLCPNCHWEFDNLSS